MENEKSVHEKSEQKKQMKGGKTNTELYIQLSMIAMLLVVISFSAGKISAGIPTGASITDLATGIGSVSASSVIPSGIPDLYGEEIGVSYDDVSPSNPSLADVTIDRLTEYEDMTLSGDDLERYIKVAGAISCEYCCGADSIIFESGERACGCAHSYAMRGLAKYLITEHPEMSDEEILSELGKWKVLFFPGIHEQKAQVLESQGIDSTNYINLASNLYRGVEKGQTSGGGMVGGC